MHRKTRAITKVKEQPQRLYVAALVMFLTLIATVSFAWSGELTGSVSVEGRVFLNNETLPNQDRGDGFSLVLEPEYYHVWNSEKDTFTFAPFLHLDQVDSDRTHADIRQLDWVHVADSWETQVGISKVFWGVAESNHLVDIINQTDAVESVDGEDKLGQPMVQVALMKDWGTLRMFALPYFRERTFAGVEGRLRNALVVDTDNPVYEDNLKERHLDTAVRYENTFADWDVGVAHFSGTSRAPVLVAGVNAGGDNVLIPYYTQIDQTSADVQYTTDSWLWKFEGLTRGGQGERFNAMVGGFEYTFYGVNETDVDVGFLAEYHKDDRGILAPRTIFDDDLFIASRLVMNDVPDTQLLAGLMVDRLTKARSYSVEASRRIGDRWKAELEGRFFAGHASPFRQEDFVLLRLARFF